MLELRDVIQIRPGAVTTICRYVSQNAKVRVGYNFTDFSDALTDLRTTTKAHS